MSHVPVFQPMTVEHLRWCWSGSHWVHWRAGCDPSGRSSDRGGASDQDAGGPCQWSGLSFINII